MEFTWPSGPGSRTRTVRSSCRCPCSVVAGRWTFPLPPWPYALPRGPSRSSDGVTPVRGFLRSRRFRADPQVLAPLRSMLPFNPGRFSPTSSPGLGRGGRRRIGGFHRRFVVGLRFPSPPTLSGVHSRKRYRLLRSRRIPLRNPVPPSWFCTTSMVSSARRSRACCIPLPVMRFASFPASTFRKRYCTKCGTFRIGRAFPAAPFTPLEELPPTAAVPHRCGRCPLAVPSFQLGFVARFRCRFQVSKLRGSECRLRGFPPLSGP
jgi:hypothetical protein